MKAQFLTASAGTVCFLSTSVLSTSKPKPASESFRNPLSKGYLFLHNHISFQTYAVIISVKHKSRISAEISCNSCHTMTVHSGHSCQATKVHKKQKLRGPPPPPKKKKQKKKTEKHHRSFIRPLMYLYSKSSETIL